MAAVCNRYPNVNLEYEIVDADDVAAGDQARRPPPPPPPPPRRPSLLPCPALGLALGAGIRGWLIRGSLIFRVH